MRRITLDVSDEQHRQLKTISSYSGLSMREFILSRVFSEAAETVFEGSKKSKTTDELEKIQDIFFDKKKKQVILSEKKWIEIQNKASR